MARVLVADGANSFYRVLVDPRDGAPLEIGRTSYRLTKAMRNWLRLRDGKCPFPGCSNNALDNEADHLLAWHQGGTTGISNLGQPCPKHHKLRYTAGWQPTPATQNEPPGWISPAGRHYKSEHPDWEPPVWPPGSIEASAMPRTHACPAEDVPFLEPPLEPPLEEPPDDNFLDPDDLPAEDPLWEAFYAGPVNLPQDPVRDWELALS
ncbi:HNH endonuclease signature motif containing protein [Arthrobacter sp. D3-16]